MPRLTDLSLSVVRYPLLLFVVVAGVLSVIGSGGGGEGETPQLSVPRLPGKTFGGGCNDKFWSVQQTVDGGFIIAGFTCSTGAGGYDAWLIKTDAVGNVLKEKTFGGIGNDFGFSVQQTTDGGYILTGAYNAINVLADPAFPVDLSGELFLRKLNDNFDLEWETIVQDVTVLSSYYPYTFGYSVLQTADGGYIVAGATGTGGGGGEGLLLKTDANGAVTWKVFLGGEYAAGVRQTGDGGYIVATTATVGRGQLIKTNATGGVLWSTLLSGSAAAIGDIAGGGSVVTGIDNFGSPQSGDLSLGRIDASGALLWEKTFGGTGGDQGHSVQQTTDLGYVAAGRSGSYGANTGFDVYLVKTDANGSLEWQKTYTGAGADIGRAVRQTVSGGYVIVGETTSGTAGDSDAFLIRTDASGNAL